MKTDEAIRLISALAGKPLGLLELDDDFRRSIAESPENKGAAGQILERAIGLPLNTRLKDLEDGELKTTLVRNGKTKESLFLTQLNHLIVEITANVPWRESSLRHKIEQFVLVPCVKDSQSWEDWFFLPPLRLSEQTSPSLKLAIEEDYRDISKYVRDSIINEILLGTFNGRNKILQIRTKGSKEKNPMYFANQIIAEQYYAFYFTPRFVRKLVSIHLKRVGSQ